MARNADAESIIREIKRRTRKKYSSEERIRIVLERLRGNRPACVKSYESSRPRLVLKVPDGIS